MLCLVVPYSYDRVSVNTDSITSAGELAEGRTGGGGGGGGGGDGGSEFSADEYEESERFVKQYVVS